MPARFLTPRLNFKIQVCLVESEGEILKQLAAGHNPPLSVGTYVREYLVSPYLRGEMALSPDAKPPWAIAPVASTPAVGNLYPPGSIFHRPGKELSPQEMAALKERPE